MPVVVIYEFQKLKPNKKVEACCPVHLFEGIFLENYIFSETRNNLRVDKMKLSESKTIISFIQFDGYKVLDRTYET